MKYSKKHLILYYVFSVPLLLISIFALNLAKNLAKKFCAPLLFLVIGIALLLLFKFSIDRISSKIFLDILIREQNSQKFHGTIYHPPLFPALQTRVVAEWYVGNYEKMILLAQTGYQSSKNLRMKLFFLGYLARAYFDLYQIDNLKAVTDVYFKLERTHPKLKENQIQHQGFCFYKSFLDRDYESCIKYLNEQLNSDHSGKQAYQLRRLTQQISLPVCLYWKGEKQQAKEQFESFKQSTPNLKNFNDLADRYLSAIDSDDDSALCVTVPDTIDRNAFQRKFRISRNIKKTVTIIFSVLLILSLTLALTAGILNKISDIISDISYENMIEAAVDKNYENAECIKYFYVEAKDDNYETLCIIEHEDGLDLTSLVTYDGGKTCQPLILVKNLQIPYEYSIKSDASGSQIDFYISDEKIPKSGDNQVIKFTSNHKKYWIEIKNVIIPD